MKSKKLSKDEYLIKLNAGEDIKGSLIEFAKKQKVKFGIFQGIGAISKSILSFYNPVAERYEPRTIDRFAEIVTLMGTIARGVDREVLIHAHMTISDKDHKAFGGHVEMGCIIGVTCEIYLKKFNKKILRKPEFKKGLKLLDI